MAFDIYLMKSLSDSNVVNKNVSTISKFTGDLKSDTSILTPNLIIESDINFEQLSQVNYMYIPIFDRYYFVNDIIIVRSGLYEFKCKVDVLMSYKSYLKQKKAIVERQANNWNLYLKDTEIMTYSDPVYIAKKFPKSLTRNTTYLLTVAGA